GCVWGGAWVALVGVWYMGAPSRKSPAFKIVASTDGKVGDQKPGAMAPTGRVTIALRATPTIAAGQAWEGNVVLYAGPKEYERLRALGLEEKINFGCFPLPCAVKGTWTPALPPPSPPLPPPASPHLTLHPPPHP